MLGTLISVIIELHLTILSAATARHLTTTRHRYGQL